MLQDLYLVNICVIHLLNYILNKKTPPMASQAVTCLSQNCRGLREYTKRSNLFYWLKHHKYGIKLLQETYWTQELCTKIEKEWGGVCLINPGTIHRKGTAILFNKSLDLNIISTHKSEDSRIVLTNLKVQEKKSVW